MRKFLAAAVVVLGFSTSSHAALVAADLFTTGDGLLVRDTTNNREWVDVTATTNMSANASLALYQPMGFEIAKSADVHQLFVSAGIPDILLGVFPFGTPTTGTVANRAPVEALLALMNHAPPYPDTGGNQWIHGYTDYGSSTNLTLSRFAAFAHDNIGRANVNTNGYISWTYDTRHSAVGTFLVRNISTVPLPAALPLLAGGLGILGFMGWRRKRAA